MAAINVLAVVRERMLLAQQACIEAGTSIICTLNYFMVSRLCDGLGDSPGYQGTGVMCSTARFAG